MRELKAALEMEPGNARAHLNLGSVYLQTGQESPAKNEFEKALDLDPWLVEAHNNLGMMLAKNEQFEDAAKHFRLAADLEPHYLEALGLLRNSRLSCGRTRHTRAPRPSFCGLVHRPVNSFYY